MADDHPALRTGVRLGFGAAALTLLLTLVSFAMAFLTPPRSGPSCSFDECVGSPYTDIAEYFPRDYLWMFPATLVPFVFLVLLVCVHYYAPPGRQPFTMIALLFASMASVIIATDYFIQLTVIQPSVIAGESDGLSLFSQYNPHGVFIALEAIGYLVMTAALLFTAPVFTGRSGIQRTLPWLFGLPFVLAVAALVGLTAAFGQEVEYRFEIAVISIAWTGLALSGVVLSVLFWRDPELRL